MYTLNIILELFNSSKKKQKDLCEFLKINLQSVTDWKTGKNETYKKYLPQIAEFFNVPIETLIENYSFNSENKINFDKQTLELFNLFKDLSEDDKKIIVEMARRLNKNKE